MKLWKEDLLANIFKFAQGIFDIYCQLQSKDMTDFHNLQGKLVPVTLRRPGLIAILITRFLQSKTEKL